MKTRKPNFKDKINIVKECIISLFKAFLIFNIDEIKLYWVLMLEGLRGNCEVVEEGYDEQNSIST